MRKHIYHNMEIIRERDGICYACAVTWCSACDCDETDLTNECCGREITTEESDLIVQGKLDFINGLWQYKLEVV